MVINTIPYTYKALHSLKLYIGVQKVTTVPSWSDVLQRSWNIQYILSLLTVGTDNGSIPVPQYLTFRCRGPRLGYYYYYYEKVPQIPSSIDFSAIPFIWKGAGFTEGVAWMAKPSNSDTFDAERRDCSRLNPNSSSALRSCTRYCQGSETFWKWFLVKLPKG